MNIFQEIKATLSTLVEQCYDVNAQTLAFAVEPPREKAHGYISTNIAMVLAGVLQQKPRDIAEKICPELKKMEWVKAVDIAGPGFINMTLHPLKWFEVLAAISQLKEQFGQSHLGQNEKINVEYVSANPTGPMHIGHARGAVYGDALCNLLIKAGYDVTREYYINDAGAQIDTLARSAYLRYLEALGDVIGTIPEGLYPGDYLKPVGVFLADRFKDKLRALPEAEWLPIVKDVAVEQMMLLIKKDLADLGIYHHVFSSERELHEKKKIQEVLALLKAKDLIYQGVLEPPKGKKPEDWEPREQLLFKATGFGDDIDRPIQKSDGTYTYFAADIAYHYDKLQRGFNRMVLILGADHGGYVKRISAVVGALSDRRATVQVKLAQLVNFVEDGQPLKMSKRKGTFTTVRDVVEEVGADVVRFIMLMRKNDMVLDFDLKLVKEYSKDNPVFYVQYAHARCHSVMQMAQKEMSNIEQVMAQLTVDQLALMTDEAELDLLKLLAAWPRAVESAALAFEPHRIAFFIYEVASAFHALWNRGKDHAMLKFVLPDHPELTAARLTLVEATAAVVRSGLAILGVKPVNVME